MTHRQIRRLIIIISSFYAFTLQAADKALLQSQLGDDTKSTRLFFDVTGDGNPDILEAWWNNKRCRWFDENGDMKKSDMRGDMVAD